MLGSLSGSLLLGRLRGVDIRERGSGNAGATNALRTLGLPFAIGVALFDVAKGMLAVSVIAHLSLPGISDPQASLQWLMIACGMAAVIGHIYPCWHQFRGGKGAATVIGAYCMLAPKIIAPALAVFVVTVIASGFVGLATILAVSMVILFCIWLYPGNQALLFFAIGMALLIVFAHRSNIARMLQGEENRMQRAMFWRK